MLVFQNRLIILIQNQKSNFPLQRWRRKTKKIRGFYNAAAKNIFDPVFIFFFW